MKARQLAVKGLTIAAIACAPAASALAAKDDGLVQAVRQATQAFHDVSAATAAGYSSAGSCVTGPERGAMGVHWPNGTLVGDGMLDASKPEILIYEHKGSRMRLLGVEFIVIAEQWHATNASPPVLMGQHFHYVGAPNRYGLPAFYELHVWAWRENPNGSFVDWHPHVSCDDYTGG